MSVIYLAGPINGCTDAEAYDWRHHLTEQLAGHTIISPMARDYREKEDENVSEIVEGDKEDIVQSHVVVAYCPRPSVGTSMEVFFAWLKGKRVVVYAPEGTSISPWLRYHSDAVVFSAREVVEYVSQVSTVKSITRVYPGMYS